MNVSPPHPPRAHDPMAKGRIEAFSDAVIAVAITLLVLDLRVPESRGAGTLARGLIDQWPNYVAYLTSFLAIGIMWVNHHTMLRRLTGVDHSVLVLNLLLLACIVVLPFSTSILANYLDAPADGHLAAVVYAGSFVVTSLVFLMLQHHLLRRRRHLLRTAHTPAATRVILRRAAVAPPAYVLAAGLGLVTPYLTLGLCAVLGIFYLLAPPTVRSHAQAGRDQAEDGSVDDNEGTRRPAP